MRTLISLQLHSPLTTHSTQCNHKISHNLTFHNNNINRPFPSRTWKLYAGAKGFGSKPPANLRRQQQESREENASNKLSTDIKKAEDEDDDKIPDEVWERMMPRILISVGVPMTTGVALLQACNFLKEREIWDVPIWVPFMTTLFTFSASAMGIAYGTLSTSWDAEKKGSVLGIEEARKNWIDMWREEEEIRN